jgi:hypothetical protein
MLPHLRRSDGSNRICCGTDAAVRGHVRDGLSTFADRALSVRTRPGRYQIGSDRHWSETALNDGDAGACSWGCKILARTE